MKSFGTFRLHFNRHGAAPLVWSISLDLPSPPWEIAVAELEVRVPLCSRHWPKVTPDDEDGRPSAWFEATGTFTVDAGGKALIT